MLILIIQKIVKILILNNNVNTFEEDLFKNLEDNHEYSIYRVYTVKEEDSVDIICDKFQTTKDILTEYNDLDNIGIGSKIIIPSKDEQIKRNFK